MEEALELEQRPHRRKRKWKKIIFITIGIIALLIITGLLYANHYINKSLPEHEGTIQLPILKEEVTVITDEHGVPHIKAETDQDLYAAHGYIQAQSRLFQMELSRRQASGTLSEVVGESSIETDKYLRTLGLRRAAEKSMALYSDEDKQRLEWLSEGVNAYIGEAKETGSLPIEFTLLGSEPAEWTPLDSLTIGKYMAYDLGGHWESQAFNYYALHQFEEEKAYELFPSYPEEKPTIIGEDEVDVAHSFEHALIPEPFTGSNNWVVSCNMSASGQPLLADDPHLGLATPSVWYQMHLETNDLNVSGVIFAGVPGIILGHNKDIAWGVTNTGPDVQQLYLEKRNPENPEEFMFEGEWEPDEVIDEPIDGKGEVIDYQVVETRHGPVISEFAEDSGEDNVLSLRWTALEPTTELKAIIEINHATNWKEFETGLEKFLAPAQNFVFAAKDGTIAYKANGNIPIYENSEEALLPLPGWEKEYEWDGYIPFDELPTVIDPDKGFIATANNKVVGDEYPYHISHRWAQPYRYERIAEVLEAKDDFTAEDMKALQMDTMNLRAREFVPLFVDQLAEADLNESATQALESLAEWDFNDGVSDSQPLVFQHWFMEIEALLYTEIPDNMLDLFSGKAQTTDQLLRTSFDQNEESIWFTDQGGLNTVLEASLESTVDQLEEEYGIDQTKWEWGDYHQVEFKHPLSSIHPVLAYFFNHEEPIPVGGSRVTPMAASYDQETGEVNHGASWRFVIDVADLETGHHIVGPGQAEHFRSDWYHDQMTDWVDGTFHETTLTDPEGLELTLTP